MKAFRFKYYVLGFFSILIVLSFFAFDQKEEENPLKEESDNIPILVQKELDRRLENYKQTILNKCRTKAIEDAEFYIDSLVAEELKLQTSDTIRFPAKPVRPILEGPIILNDSTPISPIIKE